MGFEADFLQRGLRLFLLERLFSDSALPERFAEALKDEVEFERNTFEDPEGEGALRNAPILALTRALQRYYLTQADEDYTLAKRPRDYVAHDHQNPLYSFISFLAIEKARSEGIDFESPNDFFVFWNRLEIFKGRGDRELATQFRGLDREIREEFKLNI